MDVMIRHGAAIGAYDYHASVFDLPHSFGTTLETIRRKFPICRMLPPDGSDPAGQRRCAKKSAWYGAEARRMAMMRGVRYP